MVAGIHQFSGETGTSTFLKLPEAPFSSAPTTAFLNPLTVEKPGNNPRRRLEGKW